MSVIDQNASRFSTRTKTGVVSLFSSTDDTARFTAHWHRPSAVLVSVTGEIDAVNAGHLTEYATRYLDGHRTLVLDLEGLRFFGTDGLVALDEIRRHCAMQGIEWSVIPGRAVRKLLDISGDSSTFPVSDSIPEVWRKLAL
ncbi:MULTISPECIES: STAS domain-containing protein [unclassified Mycobacterium]|uniref:STAS domain-containing protein n=1 Tax=unclassified Mycobacterium TaxID=2642494 RepID=UPI0009946727|nr:MULTISPECIES: STAS domain-containing protein [unclassified Mycobacterium]